MRTTIGLEDQVLEQAKKMALAHHVSVSKYIELAVREKLASEVAEANQDWRPLKTWKGSGVSPGVDLNDSARLLELLDAGHEAL